SLAMPRGSAGGGPDTDRWPRQSAAYSTGGLVAAVTSQTNITIHTGERIARLSIGGMLSLANVAAMMVWDDRSSRFDALDVSSIRRTAASVYVITLNNAPAKTLAVNDVVSPNKERALVIGESIEGYFDELGPSELVDSTDVRFVRAARFPRPDQEYSSRA